jgi:hypothetical protein
LSTTAITGAMQAAASAMAFGTESAFLSSRCTSPAALVDLVVGLSAMSASPYRALAHQ